MPGVRQTTNGVVQTNGGVASTVADAIPDSGVYLDDFQDAKLSSRDTYSTTELTPESLEPSTSPFSDPSRPEYTEEVGNGLSVSTGTLTLSGSTDYVMHTPLNIDLSQQDVTWEFQITHDGTSNGADHYKVTLSNINYTAQDNGNNDTHWTADGYDLYCNDAGSNFVKFGYNVGRGVDDAETLITGSTFQSGSTQTIKITRTAGGTWEMLQNGTSQGTATDTTQTNTSYTGIAGDSRANVDVDYYVIY